MKLSFFPRGTEKSTDAVVRVVHCNLQSMCVYGRFPLGSVWHTWTGPCFTCHPGGCGVPASGCCHRLQRHFSPWAEGWAVEGSVACVVVRRREVEGKEGQGEQWESPAFHGGSSRLPSGGALDPGTSAAGQAAWWWCMPSPPSQEGLCGGDLNQQFLRG